MENTMRTSLRLLPIALLALTLGLVYWGPNSSTSLGDALTEADFPSMEMRPLPAAKVGERTAEPRWNKWPRLREVSDPKFGVILGDIESHLPRDHQYSDTNKMTWAHESTHGINANIRNKVFSNSRDNFNAFYVLQDRSVVLKEPNISISDVAKEVPDDLRGPSFRLYLTEQALVWGDRPLYLMDEWVAYTNGAEAGKELNIRGWYYELLQAHNFNVYCLGLAMVMKRDVSDYDDVEFKKFLMWNTDRVFRISMPSDRTKVDLGFPPGGIVAVSNGHICPHQRVEEFGSEVDLRMVEDYVEKLRKSQDAEKLRKFAREYLGEEWCKRVYGF